MSRGDVCLPRGVKEIFYFDTHFDKGDAFYRAHFQLKKNHRIMSEITTTAFDDPHAPQRVLETLGADIRLLCPLRHPISRSYSLYRHYLRYGMAKGTLREVCSDHPRILTSSHYTQHIQNWQKVFPDTPLTFTYQEDLSSDQNMTVRIVCDAFSIPFKSVPKKIKNKINTTTSGINMITKHAQNGAQYLRNKRLYSVVNIAKAAGLKRLIFGKDRQASDIMSIEERDFLTDSLQPEIDQFENTFGHVECWHD